MTTFGLDGFKWLSQEELRKISLERDLTSDELLALKSRSFYLPIWYLELARGPDEANKRSTVTALYNILREQDTAEDANKDVMPAEVKITELDHFRRLVNELARRNPTESIDDLILDMDARIVPGHPQYDEKHPEYGAFTRLLSSAAMDDDERIFVDHFGRGNVFKDLHKYATRNVKKEINACSESMSIGMKHFLKNSKIETKKDLDYYCSYVAGDVGVALNGLVEVMDGKKLDINSARTFGRALQQVNVLKNIHEDWAKRKVVYIPKEYYNDVDNETLFNIESKEGKNSRKYILEQLIGDSRKALETSLDYVMSVPNELSGYKAFIIVPLGAGIETINSMNKACADGVFSGKPEAIKMNDAAFANLSKFAYQLMTSEGGKRSNDFLEAYKEAQGKNPYKMSFWPDKFEKWSKDYLKA